MKPSLLAGLALLSVAFQTGISAAKSPIATANEAITYLLDTDTIADSPSIRVFELAERITPGIRRWRVTFVSADFLVSIKVDHARETEELARFDGPGSFYEPTFVQKLPAPRDFPDSEPFIEKARALIVAEMPDATVEPGHILVYKICQPDVESDHANGCKRDKPLREWRIFLKVTPPGGDWIVKKVLFADDEPAAISDGPRGYFE